MSNEKPLTRPRYFSGQLLTAEDFRTEQDYFLEKQRRHNRSLHGYGTVWGLDVRVDGGTEAVQSVVVSPGLAIDRYGNEILVPTEQTAQLSAQADDLTARVFLCYEETPTEFVPIPGNPGEAGPSAASRIVENFKLCLVAQEAADCGCLEPGLPPVQLAQLQRTPAGWKLDQTFHQIRLRKVDEKMVFAAGMLGVAVGAALGLLFRRR